jgi:Protein of unknown function (DUF2971)
MGQLEKPVLPPFLYRYRSISRNYFQREIDSIVGKYLWCSNYKEMNDPMEGFYIATRRLEKFTNFDRAREKIFDIKQTVGICSFSDTNDNEIMWSHYADNYKGICIGYRPRLLIKGLPPGVRVARLGYGYNPPEIGIHESEIPEQAARTILSHKKASWQHEREWRVFGPCGQVFFKGNCIAELGLGLRIDDREKQKLLSTFSKSRIRIYQMTVNEYEHGWDKINL